jgi:hypothetical protein
MPIEAAAVKRPSAAADCFDLTDSVRSLALVFTG